MNDGHRVRLLGHCLLWLCFFLLPVVAICADGLAPHSVPLSLELVYITAVIGCGCASATAPLSRWIRIYIFLVSFWLFAVQFVVLGVILLIVGGLEGTQ
jgi:hypothetical protein